jgi:hypothetical protein
VKKHSALEGVLAWTHRLVSAGACVAEVLLGVLVKTSAMLGDLLVAPSAPATLGNLLVAPPACAPATLDSMMQHLGFVGAPSVDKTSHGGRGCQWKGGSLTGVDVADHG